MAYRNGNYSAFYVAEPFSETNLGANAARDFVYYNLLRAWKKDDSSFPFIDSHGKTYNVRDGSDWERTLKPRLHHRLDNSKNMILFLSSITKNSRALREEIDYGLNKKELPIIVVYPEQLLKSDIANTDGITEQVKNLWNKLPSFRDNKYKVPVIHVPMKKELIRQSLEFDWLDVKSKGEKGDHYFKIN